MVTVVDPLWYRVADLRPRLRLHLKIQRRITRGRVWYVLCDDSRQTYYRLDAAAYQFVGRLNGATSVEAAWRATHRRLKDRAPTQNEALRILQQLSDDEAIWLGGLGDMSAVLKRKKQRRNRMRESIANPLSFKVALFDPTAWVQRLNPLTQRAFSLWGAVFWTLLVGAGALVSTSHWQEIKHGLTLNAHTATFMLQMWFVYPLIKLIHESSHAMALSRWGGRVKEFGFNVLMLTPLPYVDASSANGFPQRSRRMLVSAAGVMAELAIASVAMLVWQSSNSSSLQQMALAIAAACGVSTLLVNANPLTRFDGYYFLCDWLDTPNLAQRGNRMVAHLFERAVGAARASSRPEASGAQAALVTVYAVLSWCYQGLVVYGLSYWLCDTYPRVATAVGIAGTFLLVMRPLRHMIAFTLLDFRLTGRRIRALATVGTATAVLAVLLLFVPAPSFTTQQGVIWTPSEAMLRADSEGELKQLLVHEGDHVQPGQLVAVLDNLELRSKMATALSEQQQLDLRYFDALLDNPLEARKIDLERAAAAERVKRIADQIDARKVKATVAGTLVVYRDRIQPGRPFSQGDEFGYVIPEKPQLLLKVALTEADAALVRDRTTSVSVHLNDNTGRILPARLERETPKVVHDLPTPVLSSANGGPVPTDPGDANGLHTLAGIVIFDVVVDGIPTTTLGAKSWVRFNHPSEPVGVRWARQLTQVFLARFGSHS